MTKFNEIPFPPNSSVVAYLRDSGGEEQELSILEQEKSIRSWCEKHQITLTQIFKDAARSGTSTVGRIAFTDMLEYFHKPGQPESGVIFWSYSRFSRAFDDAIYYTSTLRHNGYIPFSINDNIPDSPEGRIFESIIHWMDQRYSEDLAKGIKRGLHYVVEEYGAMPGHPPLGFKRETFSIGKHRDGSPRLVSRWVIDETIAPTIRTIWNLRANGHTIREIHEKYRVFKNRSTYTTFFRNRLYIGELRYGSLVIPDYVSALITLETWNAVQKMNNQYSASNNPIKDPENIMNPRRLGGSFLLSGLVFCARCGSIMNGQVIYFGGKKRNDYYTCTGKTQKMTCDAPRIPRETVEQAVIKNLVDYISDPEIIKIRHEMRVQSESKYKEKIATQIKSVKKSISDNERRIGNLVQKISDEPDAPSSIIQTIRTLEEDTKKLQNELMRLQSLDKNRNLAQPLEDIQGLAEKLLRVVSSENFTEKKSMVRLLINRISVERIDDKINGIIYFYQPNTISDDFPSDPVDQVKKKM